MKSSFFTLILLCTAFFLNGQATALTVDETVSNAASHPPAGLSSQASNYDADAEGQIFYPDGRVTTGQRATCTTICTYVNGTGNRERAVFLNTMSELGLTVMTTNTPTVEDCVVFVTHEASAFESPGSSVLDTYKANGGNIIQISDWGPNYIPATFPNWAFAQGPVTVTINGLADPISAALTAGLPASWTTTGWYNASSPTFNGFIGGSGEVTDLNMASTTDGSSAFDRSLTARIEGSSQLVYIGWNMFLPTATPEDLQVLVNALTWTGACPTAGCSDLPVASCSNTTVQLDANGMGSISVEDIDNESSDPCEGTLSFSLSQEDFTCADLGANTVTLSVTNENGTSTCTATVMVADGIPPTITTCMGGSVDFDGEYSFETSTLVEASAMDNCGAVSISYSPSYIYCFQIGTTVTVTVTATDGSGNPSTCTADVEVTGLPCGFSNTSNCDGEASYDVPTETFTLEATDCVSGPPFIQDEMAMTTTELCGDGEIVALVTDIDFYAWAGVIMRETPSAGSKMVALSRDNGYFARREVRSTTNGPAYPQQFNVFGKNWLRLVRNGNMFMGFVSSNGQQWQMVLFAQVAMENCIEVGLYLTNMQGGQTTSADFNYVDVTYSETASTLGALPNTAFDAPNDMVSVYPNPAADIVTVDLADMADQAQQIELMNTNGQLVRQIDLGQAGDLRTTLHVSDLPSGVYWLKINLTDQAPITKRLIIE